MSTSSSRKNEFLLPLVFAGIESRFKQTSAELSSINAAPIHMVEHDQQPEVFHLLITSAESTRTDLIFEKISFADGIPAECWRAAPSDDETLKLYSASVALSRVGCFAEIQVGVKDNDGLQTVSISSVPILLDYPYPSFGGRNPLIMDSLKSLPPGYTEDDYDINHNHWEASDYNKFHDSVNSVNLTALVTKVQSIVG